MPVFKGTYAETLTAGIAAFRAGEQPAIVQVFEVGTGTMMAAKGAVYPVYQLMADQGEPFDPKAFLPSVVGYYTDPEGNMLSMPFNSSTPIMYYNKDVFQKAGLDPETPPEDLGRGRSLRPARSWPPAPRLRLHHAAGSAGSRPRTSRPGTTVPFGTNGQRLRRPRHRARCSTPRPSSMHWDEPQALAGRGLFQYGGPAGGNDAPPKFYAQAMRDQHGLLGAPRGVIGNAKDFEVGFGMLPYYDDVEGAPQNSIIGGATLWVCRASPAEEYKGVAKFFTYLSLPEVQADWHQNTGYLPITKAAYELSQSRGYYDDNPGPDIPSSRSRCNAPTENSKGLRFGNYVQIRDVIDEEFEAMLAGKKSAKEALDSARGARQALIAASSRRPAADPFSDLRGLRHGAGPFHVRTTCPMKRTHLPQPAALPSAPRTAACRHGGLLPLACRAGELAVASSGRTPSASPPPSWASTTTRTSSPIRFTSPRSARRCVLRPRHVLSMGVALILAVAVGPADPGGRGLHDAARLALRRRPGGGGRPLVVHVQPHRRHPRLRAEGCSASTGTTS